MKARKDNGKVVIVELPSTYKGVENVLSGYAEMEHLHLQDGFYPVVIPTLLETEELGELYIDIDNSIATYTKVPKQVVIEMPIDKRQLKENCSREISGITGMQEAIERFIIMGEHIPQKILDIRQEILDKYYEAVSKL